MKISTIALILFVLFTARVQADTYEVQGIHRHNYPGTVNNLRGLKTNGASKYPDMHWLPVEEIRRLLATPQ